MDPAIGNLCIYVVYHIMMQLHIMHPHAVSKQPLKLNSTMYLHVTCTVARWRPMVGRHAYTNQSITCEVEISTISCAYM